MPARDFARQHLFAPMGEEVGPWPADPRGYNYGGHGIGLTARSLVKMGRLFLDRGTYQGRRIVSADWVRQSTLTRWDTLTAVPWGTGYGYLWWTGTDARTGLSFFFANGYGGQFVIDVPAKNTVIVATTRWSGVPNAGDNWYYVLRAIVENILPSL
jgi:CubicO group peptidase (beta-lactamase class C family)